MKSKILYTFMFISIFFLCIGSVAHAFQLEVSASQTNVPVKSTVDFTCTPTGGTPPYTYSWDFDDVNSYKTPSTAQNPSHTFNWLGKHYVWVSVTDSAGSPVTEKALLVVSIRYSVDIETLNVCTGCGANNLDNTGSSDNKAKLEACIAGEYESAKGLRLEFPSGTYRFDDATEYPGGANERRVGLEIGGLNLEFIGTGATQPILKFYGDTSDTGAADGGFISYRNDSGLTRHLLLRNIKLLLDQDPDNYGDQQLAVVDSDVGVSYVTIEDATIESFPKIGQFDTFRFCKSTITKCGNYNDSNRSADGAIEHLRLLGDALVKYNYFADGDGGVVGHSHFIYNSGVDYFYIVGNYFDGINQQADKLGCSIKNTNTNFKILGNIIRNTTNPSITGGAWDATGWANVVISDNRFINSGFSANAVGIVSSSGKVLIDDNFFTEVDSYILGSGDASKCAAGNDAIGITLSNNIFGNEAGTDGDANGVYNDAYGACTPGEAESNVTISGNTDDTTTTKAGDPAGWISGGAYVDPGAWEYAPPTNCSVSIVGESQSVTLLFSATDSGSGMGSDARFPFKYGGLMQFSNDGVTWSEVRPYGESTIWILADGEGPKTVYARFRDRHGNWSEPVSSSASAVPGARILRLE